MTDDELQRCRYVLRETEKAKQYFVDLAAKRGKRIDELERRHDCREMEDKSPGDQEMSEWDDKIEEIGATLERVLGLMETHKTTLEGVVAKHAALENRVVSMEFALENSTGREPRVGPEALRNHAKAMDGFSGDKAQKLDVPRIIKCLEGLLRVDVMTMSPDEYCDVRAEAVALVARLHMSER